MIRAISVHVSDPDHAETDEMVARKLEGVVVVVEALLASRLIRRVVPDIFFSERLLKQKAYVYQVDILNTFLIA